MKIAITPRPKVRPSVAAELADITNLLALADKLLGKVASAWIDATRPSHVAGVSSADIAGARAAVKFSCELLVAMIGNVKAPSNPLHKLIGRHVNATEQHAEHVEAAILALTLADNRLAGLLEQGAKPADLIEAARVIVGWHLGVVGEAALPQFDPGKALDELAAQVAK